MTIKKITALLGSTIILSLTGCNRIDDTTELGSGFVKNYSDFDVVQHKIYDLNIISGRSFQDTLDKSLPGITANKDLLVGNYNNLFSISYLDFDGKDIEGKINDIAEKKGTITDFRFTFEIDTVKSDAAEIYFKLGKCYYKNNTERISIDSTNINDIGHTSSDAVDSEGELSISLDISQIKTDIISFEDITTTLNVKGTKFIEEITYYDTSIFIETINDSLDNAYTKEILYSIYGNKAYKDTLYTTYETTVKPVIHIGDTINNDLYFPLDTLGDTAGLKKFVVIETKGEPLEIKDTIITPINETLNDTSYNVVFTKDTTNIYNIVTKKGYDTLHNGEYEDYAIYDSIASKETLFNIYGTPNYSIHDTVKSGDSLTYILDSLYTKSDTVIDIKVTQIITKNGNILDTTFDTTYQRTEISEESIYQTAAISKKVKNLITNLLDPYYHDITVDTTKTIVDGNTVTKLDTTVDAKHLPFYLKQQDATTDVLKFIKNPKLIIDYVTLDTITNDTTEYSLTFSPAYRDYSVFESDSTSLDTVSVAIASSDRYVQLALDVSKVWEKMANSDSTAVKYKNIPKMSASLFVVSDSSKTHEKTKLNISQFLYRLSDTPIQSLWEPSGEDDDYDVLLQYYCPKCYTDTLCTGGEDTITLELDDFMQEFLNNTADFASAPKTLYLTIRLTDNNFKRILFRKNYYNLDFIVSDLKEGFEND